MKSMWIVILLQLITTTKEEETGPLISVIVDKNPVYCLEGESILLPVAIVGTVGKQVYWWSPIDNHLVWGNGVAGNITDYRDRVMSFQNGSLLIQETRLSDAGEWKYSFVISIPLSSNTQASTLQYVPGKVTLHVSPKTNTPAPTILPKNTAAIPYYEPTSLECPSLQEGPPSGLTATSIPGILFNNVKFIHVPVVLNLSQWNMAEFGSCARTNVSLFYSSLLVDLIASHASRTQDPFAEPNLTPHRGIFRSRKLKGLDSILGSIPGLFGSGMSIWNRADLSAIRRHIGNFEQKEGRQVLKPVLQGVEGLAEEERFTVYNMKDIAQLFEKTQQKINEIININNQKAREDGMGKEVICTAYGNFVLTKVTNIIRDIQAGKIPDILRDTDLTQWYCTHTNNSGGMNVHSGDKCKPLPVSTIRNIGIVTPHPNRGPFACKKSPSLCAYRDLMYVSFTMSLPVFHPQDDYFNTMASIHSLGYLENDVYKERLHLPEMLIQVQGRWKAPHTACCTVKDNRYLCRCDVFEIDTPVCGLSNDPDPTAKVARDPQLESPRHPPQETSTSEMEANCPVKLSKWRTPSTKVTYHMDGLYCVVTNHQTFLYGGQSCPIPYPNFCFIPHEYTIIGQTVVAPIPVLTEDYIIESPPDVPDPITYLPHFDIKIDTLSVNLHNLLARKDTHIIQISNDMEKTGKRLNELLHDGDFSLVTTRTWVEMGIKGLLILQCGVLLFMTGMVIYLGRLLRWQREKLNSLMEIRHKQLLT
ncbi:uncharacterized protein LOC143963402 [Lithobates pipiens]